MEKVLLDCNGISVSYDGTLLTMSCAGLERTIDLGFGTVRTASVRLGGKEIVGQGVGLCRDFHVIGMRQDCEELPFKIKNVTAEWMDEPNESPHAEVGITIEDACCGILYVRRYYLYQGIAAIGVRTEVESAVVPSVYWSRRGDLNKYGDRFRQESCTDSLRLPFCASLRSIEFFGRTDYTDHLYEEHLESELMNGNILIATGDDYGVAFLQEAPPSTERRDYERYDFRIVHDGDCTEIYSSGLGISPDEMALRRNHRFCGYRHVLFAFEDAKELPRMIKDYLRVRYPLKQERSGLAVVNPWGSGRFGERIGEQFLLDEIAATAKVNGDYYQIDDSWQAGRSLANLSIKNIHITPAFWDISDNLFGGSFAPLREAAAKAGVRLGLWLAPSSNAEYEDYMDTVALIENMHREYGFDLFKIDAVMTRTKLSEENLEALLKTALERTNGDIYFNLDTTNGQRPGYFMFLNYGNIFLENRYVCHKWGLGYHPDKTLRSLWQLSKFLCPQYLQIEIPDPADINAEFYANRPNPLDYPVEYWTAIALFANPLLWFAPSICPDDIAKRIAKIIGIHKDIWPDIHASRVYPIGDEPCGHAFTGFQACCDGGHGYILAFRESQCTASEVQIPLADVISGETQLVYALGNAKCSANGRNATLSLESPASFALWRY